MSFISMIFCLFLFLLLVSIPIASATQGDSHSAQIDTLFVEMDHPDRPGAAVLVIKDGVVLHRKGYGSANLEHQIPITPESVFDIASVSKQFAGMSISMLIERGILNLDEKTLVIWTSDNGAVGWNPPQGSNTPLRGWGYDTSEGAQRMPCIARWPGKIPAGLVRDDVTTMMDILLTDLFLTHLHYDHCIDYGYLVLSRWDQGSGKIPELQVYGPPNVKRMTEQLFGKEGVYGPDLAARTEHPGSHFIYEMRGGILPRRPPAPVVTEVTHGTVIERENWHLTVAEVIHVQPLLTCLAYRLDTSEQSIVFSGDTAPIDSLIDLARGSDILIHMCHFINGVVTDERLTSCCSGHLDAARTARQAGVKTLVLVHLTEQVTQPGVRERLIREAGQIFDGHIIFGEDLLDVPMDDIGAQEIQ